MTALPETLPESPLALLGAWYDEARRVLAGQNPEALALATVDSDGCPRARMVICRGLELEHGAVVFYTDRTSAKATELEHTPAAALVFYWGEPLHRQLRIDGPVTPQDDTPTDAYFASRPHGAQVAAWTSRQSTPLASRAELLARHREMSARFGEGPVPRPESFGGYTVWIESIEFWSGQTDRLHDRARYERGLERAAAGYRGGAWSRSRLEP